MSIIKANAWQRTNGTLFGTVLQTVGTTNPNPLVISASTTWYDVCTVSITPASTSNNILIMWFLTASTGGSWDRSEFVIRRNGTPIFIGNNTGGGQTTGKILGDHSTATQIPSYGGAGLDSPATTSAITYALSVRDGNADQTMWVNRGGAGVGASNQNSTCSSLVVQEIQN